jgi:hypothetical protein
MPAADRRSASDSGRHSGSEATKAARAPVFACASMKARAVTSHVSGFIEATVGMSRISMPMSKPPDSAAAKVAASLSSWFQMKV